MEPDNLALAAGLHPPRKQITEAKLSICDVHPCRIRRGRRPRYGDLSRRLPFEDPAPLVSCGPAGVLIQTDLDHDSLMGSADSRNRHVKVREARCQKRIPPDGHRAAETAENRFRELHVC